MRPGIQWDIFWTYVGSPDESGCWPWLGLMHKDGYGVYSNSRFAHRVTYEVAKGPIPSGLELDHLCRNRWCVNPGHLEAVTHAENMRRAVPFNRLTHCKRGHEFTDENTYVMSDANGDRRNCRMCGRQRSARYKERKMANRGAS